MGVIHAEAMGATWAQSRRQQAMLLVHTGRQPLAATAATHTRPPVQGAQPGPRDQYASQGWGPPRGNNVCGSELGAAETACRPQSPLQQAMLLGHSASAPFLGAGLHWWHGLPSVSGVAGHIVVDHNTPPNLPLEMAMALGMSLGSQFAFRMGNLAVGNDFDPALN